MSADAWNPFSAIDWTTVVPEERRLFVPVWKAKPAAPVNAISLSETITGVWIHWLGRRSAPCLAKGDVPCPFCSIQVPRRWEGYLGGFSERSGKKYLLHVSKQAAASCPMIGEGKVNLFQNRIIIERKGRAPNAPCQARVESYAQRGSLMIRPFNVQEQLLQLWSGAGGLAAMMSQCRSIEEARTMFKPEIGLDD